MPGGGSAPRLGGAEILRFLEGLRGLAQEWLTELIAIPSLSGQEAEVQTWVVERLREMGLRPQQLPVPESLREDEEYSHSDCTAPYDGRPNLVAEMGGDQGASLIWSAHTDVVPAKDWEGAFTPQVEGTRVIGRGAVDAKGQVLTALLAWHALRQLGIALKGRLEAQFVIEEEFGGNGALALIRAGRRAEGVVVLEPTNQQIHPANRGAIWFRFTVEGKPTHMGRKQEGVNAIEQAVELIHLLQDYERRLVEESRGVPQFERYEAPVQVNIGMINGGEWPSMVPAKAVLEGGVGFLPNKPMAEVKEELRALVEEKGGEWLRTHYRLEFPKLHNDSYAIPSEHALPVRLQEACREIGVEADIFGWNISCDARLYNRVGGMPTVVYGPGETAQAHAKGENTDIREVLRAAAALALFSARWCGT